MRDYKIKVSFKDLEFEVKVQAKNDYDAKIKATEAIFDEMHIQEMSYTQIGMTLSEKIKSWFVGL